MWLNLLVTAEINISSWKDRKLDSGAPSECLLEGDVSPIPAQLKSTDLTVDAGFSTCLKMPGVWVKTWGSDLADGSNNPP